MSESIYLITGATRGIGLALVDAFASADPSAVIYAGARDPSSSGSLKLKEVAQKYSGRIRIVKCVSGDKAGNEALAKEIHDNHGRVDTVISNAGIYTYLGKVHEAPIQEFTNHFAVNTLGPIVLFQAFYSLLKASTTPRFIPISTRSGSIDLIASDPLDMSPYGSSKAALNWVTRKIHFENEWLISFPLCPGGVNTDMVQRNVAILEPTGLVDAAQIEKFTRPPHVAAALLANIIQNSTREKDGGQFVNIEGGRNPW